VPGWTAQEAVPSAHRPRLHVAQEVGILSIGKIGQAFPEAFEGWKSQFSAAFVAFS
jgi:hypothetical protein